MGSIQFFGWLCANHCRTGAWCRVADELTVVADSGCAVTLGLENHPKSR